MSIALYRNNLIYLMQLFAFPHWNDIPGQQPKTVEKQNFDIILLVYTDKKKTATRWDHLRHFSWWQNNFRISFPHLSAQLKLSIETV